MSLFEPDEPLQPEPDADAPLAIRMRPTTPEEFVGQTHFFGDGKLLRRMLHADRLASVIFYGPPGTGKTTLAHVIAKSTKAECIEINAAASNVAEVREHLAAAQQRKRRQRLRTVLFVDELHRFNRAQQDILLPDVERGTVILIGATTHNPFFSINSPLVSRSQIFEFKPLSESEIKEIMRRALGDTERGLGRYRVDISEAALNHLAATSDGDARRALNAIEIGVLSAQPDPEGVIRFDVATAEESIQRKAINYDRDEDGHYDAASAFIKSMRGSDPDAALYWMAKMLEAGEDPRFIARRVVICASEDVGNASPMALLLATAALEAVEFVGLPEARIALAQAVTYIACSPKSNAAYLAVDKALQDVRDGRTLAVPDHLKGANYKGAERLGRGKGYQYAHDGKDHWVDQEYVPCDKVYYEPTDQGYEIKLKERLDALRALRSKATGKPDANGPGRSSG